jgi:RND family efflux transporter MFP subunit
MNKHLKNAFGRAKTAREAVGQSLRESSAAAPPHLKRRAKQLFVVVVVVFVAIAGSKYFLYKQEEKRRAEEIAAGPRVRVAKVKKGIGEHRVTIIGETRPYQSATLYAKVSGYLTKVAVDKGDIVKQGQILAVIESPETDEAYLAADADWKNKQSILSRMQTLHAKQLISQQEFDQAQADADVSSAHLRAQQTLKSYETLKAPFAGTITARYADAGALVQNATNSETSALPVVMISEIRRLRVDVFLDQRDAPFVQKDSPVSITLAERPGFKLEGHVARLSGELDPRTKMLLTEIDILNEDRSLVAGSFVQVVLEVHSPPYLEAPVEALALKDDKTYLTCVTPAGTLTFKPVEIGSNDGKVLSILSGIKEDDLVALNVGDSLPEGSKVRAIDGGVK